MGPDKFVGVQNNDLDFKSTALKDGYSGGPILDKNWRIVGIILIDNSASNGLAIKFDTVASVLRYWKYPIDLTIKPILQIDSDIEPTSEDMKSGLIRAMVKKGGILTPDGGVMSENFLVSVTLTIDSLKKIGCKPATDRVGFYCTYEMTVSTTYASKDRSRQAQEHAAAMNRLFGEPKTNSGTCLFANTSEGWLAVDCPSAR